MSVQIKSYKLSTGEEIIARLVEETDETVTLDQPNMVGLAPAPDGSGVVVQLMPWLASNQDGKATVEKKHIVATINPDARLEKGFLERTSGIQMVTG